jgi:hypothetical protein
MNWKFCLLYVGWLVAELLAVERKGPTFDAIEEEFYALDHNNKNERGLKPRTSMPFCGYLKVKFGEGFGVNSFISRQKKTCRVGIRNLIATAIEIIFDAHVCRENRVGKRCNGNAGSRKIMVHWRTMPRRLTTGAYPPARGELF